MNTLIQCAYNLKQVPMYITFSFRVKFNVSFEETLDFKKMLAAHSLKLNLLLVVYFINNSKRYK